jgi:hypothetical protein
MRGLLAFALLFSAVVAAPIRLSARTPTEEEDGMPIGQPHWSGLKHVDGLPSKVRLQ